MAPGSLHVPLLADPDPNKGPPGGAEAPAATPTCPGPQGSGGPSVWESKQGVTNGHGQALEWHHTEMQTLLWTFYLIPKPQGTQATAQGATGLHKYLKEQKAGWV